MLLSCWLVDYFLSSTLFHIQACYRQKTRFWFVTVKNNTNWVLCVHTYTYMLFVPSSAEGLKEQVPSCSPLSPSGYSLLLFAMCCYCAAVILQAKVLRWLSLSSQASLPYKLPSMLQSHRKKVISFLARPIKKGFVFNHIYQCCHLLKHLILLNLYLPPLLLYFIFTHTFQSLDNLQLPFLL